MRPVSEDPREDGSKSAEDGERGPDLHLDRLEELARRVPAEIARRTDEALARADAAISRGEDAIARAAPGLAPVIATTRLRRRVRRRTVALFVMLGLMALLAFALTSLGIVIANRIRSFEGFGVFSNAVILPLYFTSSSIFPLNPALTGAQTRVVYPEWLVTVVEWNPLTYAIDALRGILIGYTQFDPALGIAITAGAAVLLFAIALNDFRKL